MNVIISSISLYNARTLRNQLDLEDLTLSESELLCYAYVKWGNTLLSYLDGDFSFVLYDTENKCYFCARDPLGIKSLYYMKTEEGYRFSSNIDALLTLPSILKKPNLKSMRTMAL